MHKIIIFGVILFAFNLSCIAGNQKSYAEMTAFFDRSKDVVKYQSLYDQLTKKLNLPEKTVADQTCAAVEKLKKSKIQESYLNIMEGMAAISGPPKYAEALALYITLRNKGCSHSESIVDINDMWTKLIELKK